MNVDKTETIPFMLTFTGAKGNRISVDPRYVVRVVEHERDDEMAKRHGARFVLTVTSYYPAGKLTTGQSGDVNYPIEYNDRLEMVTAHDQILKAQQAMVPQQK